MVSSTRVFPPDPLFTRLPRRGFARLAEQDPEFIRHFSVIFRAPGSGNWRVLPRRGFARSAEGDPKNNIRLDRLTQGCLFN